MFSECKIENRIIIRVWSSMFNGGESVGHISIQTPSYYISLWPKGVASGKLKQFFESRPHDFLGSVEHDNRAEGRPAEIVICLYSLNIRKIEDKFNLFKEHLQGWTLFGSNIFNNGAAESCASLALAILRAGGLPLDYSSFSSSVTPDKMAEAIIEAKKKELMKHPETAKFRFESEVVTSEYETNIEELKYKKAKCTIS